ncbi:MAG: hypothetical protein M3O28_09350, partial [Actinomycetota bacterium]|nr:hypothetical protein [Actinomycetota bacterium]
ALIFGLSGGAGKQHATSAVVPSVPVTATGAGGPPASAQPTGKAQPTGSAIDPALARQLIVRYLNDVNTRNRADGQTLICAAKVASWRSSIDQSRGDFTVNIVQATFQGATPRSTGIELKYALQITTAGTAANNSVTFTVIDEHGLKICGEA